MTLSVRQYFALAGSRFTQADASAIGPELQELANAGDVTPAQVVEAARSTNSPLHGYFEWDDKTAADQFRNRQAEEMIHTIKVKVVSSGQERISRAYKVAVTPSARVSSREVVQFPQRVPEPMGRLDQVAASALRDLDAWLIKYRGQADIYGKFASAIAPLANQIAEFKDDFQGGHLSGPIRKAVETFLDWERTYGERVAAKLYGEHLNYIEEAVGDLREAFGPTQAEALDAS